MEKIILLIVLLTTSCVSTQKLDPATFYKNDICFKTKDKSFCGVGVMPYQDQYDLKITSYGKLNFFVMTTCHREDTTENPDKGIFKKNGVIKVSYRPTLEKDKPCPLYISAYNRNAKHAWGFIAFENPKYKLKAIIDCNGSKKEFNGVSICQSREQLLQRITFNEPVRISKGISGPAQRSSDCPSLVRLDDKSIEFKIPGRECRYAFYGKVSHKTHTLYTIGYESIIVRE